MVKLDFPFSVHLWEAKASVSIMQMLADQAENNVARAVNEADLSEFVSEGTFTDLRTTENGEEYEFERSWYSCGSCVGYDHDEVKNEYKHLIAQLTRRSAFLTIFGLFEHRMSGCLDFMLSVSGYTGKLNGGVVEKTHAVLTDAIGGRNILDVDHLTIIRNIMAHNNGVAKDYNRISTYDGKKTDSEKRHLRAIRRVEKEKAGIAVNLYGGVLMDGIFLKYVVDEIDRYIGNMEMACHAYQKSKPGA
ncbi:hypothetical protein [Dickeya zeae]|uniref:hypothetical protein n=1 Tax=Dickeya zeae TaxID=204042 RepID=UPI001F2AA330|nr:hypothetical protein [Dickeya zeae]UJR64210.1 hypothetical protein HJ586_19550 [Dickeya zeae]